MELAESVIARLQFKLHLQIHGSEITHRQLAVIVQRDKFSYKHVIYVYNFGEVRADSISVFGQFWSPRVFPAY